MTANAEAAPRLATVEAVLPRAPTPASEGGAPGPRTHWPAQGHALQGRALGHGQRELGPGAGGLSPLIGPIAKKALIMVDISLRSDLVARHKARGAGAKRVVAVVADACALRERPLR